MFRNVEHRIAEVATLMRSYTPFYCYIVKDYFTLHIVDVVLAWTVEETVKEKGQTSAEQQSGGGEPSSTSWINSPL